MDTLIQTRRQPGRGLLPARPLCLPLQQRGTVLFIALIVLVAMTLAGIGMVRSVDTGNVVAGNLAFKQATLNASDLGVETGFNWLVANAGGVTLNADNAANGYYSAPTPADSTIDWFNLASWAGAVCMNGCAADVMGNTTRYIIHRLCPATGATNGQVCAIASNTVAAGGSSKAVGATTFTQTNMVYYRVMSRVDGPRNTASVVQAFVQISQ